MGLFAKIDIPAQTLWWKASRNNVLLVNHQQFVTLSHSHQNTTTDGLLSLVKTYGYYSSRLDSIIVCLDNARYVNHSFEPNSGAPIHGNPLCSVTLRRICAGEEITEDYTQYDHCPWSNITCSDDFTEKQPVAWVDCCASQVLTN